MNKYRIKSITALLLIICICLTGCAYVFDSQSTAYTNTETSKESTSNTVSAENIILPCDSYYCEGKQYTDIAKQFENSGFTNVNIIEQKGDDAQETRVNGSVIAVSVNNDIVFAKGSLCSPNIEIKIYYISSQISEEKASDSSQSEVTASQNQTVSSAESDSDIVWITSSGKKYHSKSSCSSMKSPNAITKKEAENKGYEPCKRCYG